LRRNRSPCRSSSLPTPRERH